MEFDKEFGEFFILGECIQRAQPFKSFNLKHDILSMQIIGHQAAKGAIAAVPGKDGLSRAAAGAVLGFLVAGPVGTVVGASAGASAPKGKPGRDATEERFELLVRFANENPKTQIAYVSRTELSQLSAYLSEPNTKKESEIFDKDQHVCPDSGRIYDRFASLAEIHYRKIMDELSNFKGKSAEALPRFIDQINSPILRNVDDSRMQRLENLYLALRFRSIPERSILEIKRAMFHHSQLGDKFYYYNINGENKRLTEDCNAISEKYFNILTKNMLDKDLDILLTNHMANVLAQIPKKFPTGISLIDVSAIPQGSFLESMKFNGSFNIEELRAGSIHLRSLVGPAKFDKFLYTSVKDLHIRSHKAISKIQKKDGVSHLDLENIKQHCENLCYLSYDEEVAFAEHAANEMILKAGSLCGKKRADQAIGDLRSFIENPKGELDSEMSKIFRDFQDKDRASSDRRANNKKLNIENMQQQNPKLNQKNEIHKEGFFKNIKKTIFG